MCGGLFVNGLCLYNGLMNFDDNGYGLKVMVECGCLCDVVCGCSVLINVL